MIDLSPGPEDDISAKPEVQPRLRHDPVRDSPSAGRHYLEHLFTSESVEAAIAVVSRWMGPTALIISIGCIGWLLFG